MEWRRYYLTSFHCVPPSQWPPVWFLSLISVLYIAHCPRLQSTSVPLNHCSVSGIKKLFPALLGNHVIPRSFLSISHSPRGSMEQKLSGSHLHDLECTTLKVWPGGMLWQSIACYLVLVDHFCSRMKRTLTRAAFHTHFHKMPQEAVQFVVFFPAQPVILSCIIDALEAGMGKRVRLFLPRTL